MRIFIDTNVLAYAEGVNGEVMRNRAAKLIRGLPIRDTFISLQVLGELYSVLTRKGALVPQAARSAVLQWSTYFAVTQPSVYILELAMTLSAEHRLNFWDAVVVSSAADAGCRLLLSEDMNSGFTWAGVTIVNPFAEDAHPLLEVFLS